MCRTMSVLLILAGVSSNLIGCASPPHSQYHGPLDDLVASLNTLAKTLEQIKDPASAQQMAPKINELIVEIQQRARGIEGLPELSDDDDTTNLRNHFLPQLRNATQRCAQVAISVAMLAQSEPTLQEAVKDLDSIDGYLSRVERHLTPE